MSVKLYAGTLRDRPNESYLVWAPDELDAERYVMATLGDPSPAEEVGSPDGVAVSFVRRDTVLVPQRLVPNVRLEEATTEAVAPPAP